MKLLTALVFLFCIPTSAAGMEELPFANQEFPYCNESIPSLKFLTALKVTTIYKNSFIQNDAQLPDSLKQYVLLLDCNPSINKHDANQALHDAILHGALDEDLLQDLFAFNSTLNINYKNNLCIAAQAGLPHTAELLIKYKANSNQTIQENENPLACCISGPVFSEGQKETFTLLLQKTQDTTNPMLKAIKKGNSEAIDLLIQNGMSVNQRNTDGLPLITFACEHNNTDSLAALLKHKPNLELTGNWNHRTAFEAAIIAQNKEAMELLYEAGANIQSKKIYDLIQSNKYDLVKLLLELGINKELPGNGSPLHWAAAGGQKEIVELLLSYKCNVHTQDVHQSPVLLSAIEHYHYDIAKMLLDSMDKIKKVKKYKNQLWLLVRHLDYKPDVLKQFLDKGLYKLIEHNAALRNHLIDKEAHSGIMKKFLKEYRSPAHYQLSPLEQKKYELKLWIASNKKLIAGSALATGSISIASALLCYLL